MIESRTMNQRYLEVTFRKGRFIAAYLYLPRRPDDRSVRTERREQGLIVDYAPDGRPIGIEITSPKSVTLAKLNEVLTAIHQAPATREEVAPVLAA